MAPAAAAQDKKGRSGTTAEKQLYQRYQQQKRDLAARRYPAIQPQMLAPAPAPAAVHTQRRQEDDSGAMDAKAAIVVGIAQKLQEGWRLLNDTCACVRGALRDSKGLQQFLV